MGYCYYFSCGTGTGYHTRTSEVGYVEIEAWEEVFDLDIGGMWIMGEID